MISTEEDILELVQQRDSAAFSKLYDNYSAAIYGVVLKVLRGNEEAAQEVLQDAFVKIWSRAASYDVAKGRPFTWMVNIARNAAIDKLRSKEMRTSVMNRSIDDHVYHLAAEKGPEQLDNKDIRTVVDGLKPEHQQLIDMAYYQGYSQQEIAEHTGVPLGTVKSRTRAALIELRGLLKEHR